MFNEYFPQLEDFFNPAKNKGALSVSRPKHTVFNLESKELACSRSYPSQAAQSNHPIVINKMSNDGRQRLRPWLQSQLNSGEIPGAGWVDKSNGVFKLPWKHGGKQDWSKRDSQIFKEWAIHTGRFRAGIDKEDWSTWKTRLRCALNKLPDIQEMKDQSKLDEPDPYRVYRFLPINTEAAYPRKRQSSSTDLPKEVVVSEVNAIPTIVADQTVLSRLSGTQCDVDMDIDQPTNTCHGQSPMDYNIDGRGELVVEEYNYPTDKQTGAPMVKSENVQLNTDAVMPPEHHFCIALRFGCDVVKEHTTQKREGCRLYYGVNREGSSWLGQAGVEIYGPSESDQVCFPPYTTNQIHCETSKLLNCLDRGLVLENINGDIYATRLCRCVIFVASEYITSQTGTTKPIRLQRDNTKVKIFDFKEHFLVRYRQYCAGTGPRPRAETLISFGQDWNPDHQDYQNLFISATVTHSMAGILLQMASVDTCHLPSLHISNPDEYDRFVDQVKIVDMLS